MMRLSEAAIATQGKVLGDDVLFSSVGTDSRALNNGQLFIALQGEHFDGHAYAAQTLQQGAAAVMLSHAVANTVPALQVHDTRLAMGRLATHWRQKFTLPLAAVTGSNGKTTVKEMLAAILRVSAGDADAVLATAGNLNNDIGLPLTLLKLRAHHRYAVTEMGMNHPGEIGYITRLARPTVAVINNASGAHLEGLGSLEAIAQAKGEIFAGLAENGIAIINADDAFAALWKRLAAPHAIITFGLSRVGLSATNPVQQADVHASYQLHADYSDIQLETPAGRAGFALPVAGLHNVRNALAAAATALAMGASLVNIVSALSHFSGVKGRLQHKVGLNDALLIDDTYNANPASMKAAIDVLAAKSGEKLLILGDMGELGAEAAMLHAEIGRYARQLGLTQLFVLGELSVHTASAFGRGAHQFSSPEALVQAVIPQLQPRTSVLVKGSRFMRMERVVALLESAVPASQVNIKEETH